MNENFLIKQSNIEDFKFNFVILSINNCTSYNKMINKTT